MLLAISIVYYMTDTGNAYLRGPHEYNVLLRSKKAKKKKLRNPLPRRVFSHKAKRVS